MIAGFRSQLSWLVVLAALGGCQWPMDPTPVRELRFEGSVRNAQTGAPVPGAQVQVWLRLPDEIGPLPPFVEGLTDATGSFTLEGDHRSRGIPAALTLRVTPPSGTRLEGQTAGGLFSNVFPDVTPFGKHGRRYRTSVQLAPMP